MQNNRAPVTMSIGENVECAPTSVFIGNNAPTTIYAQPTQIGSSESGQVEVYQYHSSSNKNNTSVRLYKWLVLSKTIYFWHRLE